MRSDETVNGKSGKNLDDWLVQIMRLRKKFPDLTDVDLEFEAGNEDVLFARLELKLGKKRAELILIMKNEETGRL